MGGRVPGLGRAPRSGELGVGVVVAVRASNAECELTGQREEPWLRVAEGDSGKTMSRGIERTRNRTRVEAWLVTGLLPGPRSRGQGTFDGRPF